MKTKFIISAIVFFLGVQFLSGQSMNKTNETEILLIGSSYFNYNNLKGLIEGLADDSGKNIYIEMCGSNGLYLADHASSSSTEAKINERDWDYVILQGVGVLVAYADHFTHHPVYPALQTLHEKIMDNCPSTHMVFCLPWAFEDGMMWYQNWTETYEDMQWDIYDATLQYSDEIGFEIAPVGWAWYGILDTLDYPLHYLHLSDWNHPSLNGSYLMACVIYTTIFQESSVGNSFTAGISADEAELFQSAASDTVLNHLELWNILPLVSVNEKPALHFQLFQNTPNPFETKTTISYALNREMKVTLGIYNSKGILLAELVDQIQRPGEYNVEFDASGFASGTYFCRLITGHLSQSIVMILNQ